MSVDGPKAATLTRDPKQARMHRLLPSHTTGGYPTPPKTPDSRQSDLGVLLTSRRLI